MWIFYCILIKWKLCRRVGLLRKLHLVTTAMLVAIAQHCFAALHGSTAGIQFCFFLLLVLWIFHYIWIKWKEGCAEELVSWENYIWWRQQCWWPLHNVVLQRCAGKHCWHPTRQMWCGSQMSWEWTQMKMVSLFKSSCRHWLVCWNGVKELWICDSSWGGLL